MQLSDFEILVEKVSEPLLYHATTKQSAIRIVNSNRLEDRTEHWVKKTYAVPEKRVKQYRDAVGKWVKGVSLTRSLKFAQNWRSDFPIVFVLDKTKLKHNHRVIQVDFLSAGRKASGNYENGFQRSEMEEFVIGPISNLDRYLVEIRMDVSVYDDLSYSTRDDIVKLINHPKLKLVDI